MVKAIGPLMSLGASKQLGKSLIFKRRGSKNFITGYNKPGGKNPSPASPAQLDKRMLYNLIIARWQTFTDEQKTVWNDDPRTKQLRISGWNLFYQQSLEDLSQYIGLQGYWSFNKIVGGKILDLSGNDNDGELEPSYPNDYPQLVNSLGKKFGKAIQFNGSSNYFTSAINPTSNKFSMLFWMKIVSWIDDDYIRVVDQMEGGPQNGFSFNFGSQALGERDNLRFNIKDGASTEVLIASPNLILDTWYHIVGTFETNSAKFFVDGNQVGSTDPSCTMGTSSAIFTIGRRSDNNSDWFNGAIDDVKIYDRVLTLPEIKKHYALIARK